MGGLFGILGVVLVLAIVIWHGIAHGKSYQADKELSVVKEKLDTLQRQLDNLKRELEELKNVKNNTG